MVALGLSNARLLLSASIRRSEGKELETTPERPDLSSTSASAMRRSFESLASAGSLEGSL